MCVVASRPKRSLWVRLRARVSARVGGRVRVAVAVGVGVRVRVRVIDQVRLV